MKPVRTILESDELRGVARVQCWKCLAHIAAVPGTPCPHCGANPDGAQVRPPDEVLYDSTLYPVGMP